jgi:hypothetical protein
MEGGIHMKTKMKVLAITLAIVIVCITVAVLVFKSSQDHIVYTFSLEDYADFIHDDPVYPAQGSVETADEARDVAEKIIRDWFRKDGIYSGTSKPYVVSFDEENQVWLVQATMFLWVGGGASMIITKEEGNVLAIWNQKF